MLEGGSGGETRGGGNGGGWRGGGGGGRLTGAHIEGGATRGGVLELTMEKKRRLRESRIRATDATPLEPIFLKLLETLIGEQLLVLAGVLAEL